ncbi:MAG: hypothetical protein IPM76_06100 [Chloroflexi bacterium]|nr:hypothetical protein [Chloroflexota bacterium]
MKLHRTIAAYARSQAADGEPQAEVERALYNKASQLNKAGYPRELLPWQSHLRHVTDAAAAREGEKAANLCNELGYHLQAIGDYEGTPINAPGHQKPAPTTRHRPRAEARPY